MKRYVVVCMLLGAAQLAFAPTSIDTAAVPEPGTMLLLGAGLAGFGYLAWRRNRRK